MKRCLPLIAAISCLLCGSSLANNYYITSIGDNYEAIHAVSPTSIRNVGHGVKRFDLIAVNVNRLEMEKGVFATIGSLDVMVIEVNCKSAPRQFKEDSEYVQFSKSEERIDKSTINPYKVWTPMRAGSSLEQAANFICGWPAVKAASKAMVTASSDWEFVDRTTDTIKRINTN